MKDRLKELRGRKFIGTAQLADEAAQLVSRFVPRQERQSVSLVPDERTVRYYSTEGLLAPPEGKQGLNSVYGYQHLLQLLVIKRLQAEHHTLGRIAQVLQSASDEQVVEALLAKGPPQPAAPEPVAMAAAAGGRVELAPGGTLELPDQTLRDPDSRRRLAESLEAVARWLRNTNADTERGGDA